ncbi:MAG TPA: efflux RND transporter periplasmic adaptor subunit [bacterium]|nr:efflux RND transporter periplasmic adaptor subunit [bacterium]
MTRTRARLFLVVLASLLASCGGGKKPGDEGKPSASLFKKALQKPMGVTTAVAVARDVPLVLTEDGKSEASDRYQAKAPGRVKVQKILVEEGARVQPGDALVSFRDETLSLKINLAQAEIREAEAGIAAFGSPERPQAPANPVQNTEEGEIPAAVAEGNGENVNTSEARRDLYQAQMDRARAQLDLYEKLRDFSELVSPITGTIGRIEVGEGNDALEDQVILEVVRLDPLTFAFRMPVDEVSATERGAEIVVKFNAFPGQEFPAEVASVGTEGGSSNGGVEVKLKVANPDLTLKTDLQGTVEIRTQQRRKIVSVPEAAIVKTERSSYVYKVAGEKAQRVAVDIGTSSGGQVEIEKGLADGDTIIVSAEEGMDALRDGAPVELQAARAEN